MNSSKLHPSVQSDVLVNGGALQLVLNVLRRDGKHEIADEIALTAKPAHRAAFRYKMKGDLQWQYTENSQQVTHAEIVEYLGVIGCKTTK